MGYLEWVAGTVFESLLLFCSIVQCLGAVLDSQELPVVTHLVTRGRVGSKLGTHRVNIWGVVQSLLHLTPY